MPENPLNDDERKVLLDIARQSLERAVRQQRLPKLDMTLMPPSLLYDGASFVTLTINGELRGCIGALEAYQPLALDVQEHAVAAALDDYRFPPVRESELQKIHIEISRLTPPERLEYKDPEDLLELLKPGIDGVILMDGRQRATFLPQVWDKVPSKISFLNQLCMKMGAAPDTWRKKHLEVLIYQVEEFHE